MLRRSFAVLLVVGAGEFGALAAFAAAEEPHHWITEHRHRKRFTLSRDTEPMRTYPVRVLARTVIPPRRPRSRRARPRRHRPTRILVDGGLKQATAVPEVAGLVSGRQRRGTQATCRLLYRACLALEQSVV
jgi:hypothetical protein